MEHFLQSLIHIHDPAACPKQRHSFFRHDLIPRIAGGLHSVKFFIGVQRIEFAEDLLKRLNQFAFHGETLEFRPAPGAEQAGRMSDFQGRFRQFFKEINGVAGLPQELRRQRPENRIRHQFTHFGIFKNIFADHRLFQRFSRTGVLVAQGFYCALQFQHIGVFLE